MRVKELIAKLQKFPQNLKVIYGCCCTEADDAHIKIKTETVWDRKSYYTKPYQRKVVRVRV